MALNREKQTVSAEMLLETLADGQDIHLSRCRITGIVDINRFFENDENFRTEKLKVTQQQKYKTICLAQSLVFDRCTFEENVVFTAPWSKPDSVTVEFTQDVVFNRSHFRGQCRFRSALFGGTASFDGCIFDGVTTFKNARFRGDAKFRTVGFSGYCLLGGAVFESSARLTNTHFARGVNLSGVKFMGSTDFAGTYCSNKAMPGYDGIFFGRKKYGDDEGFWRFVKQSAAEAGYYHMSGEGFYNERSAALRSRFLGAKFDTYPPVKKLVRLLSAVRLLPEFIFGRLLFGYGERPVRVLVAAVMVILLCACFYCQPDALYHQDQLVGNSFAQGLYFSTITFTTLGYGDLYPAGHGFYRQLAMAEAIAGGCLMALFVVCLANRFSRS